MVTGETVFCDGTKVKANAAVKHSKTKKQIKKEMKKLKKDREGKTLDNERIQVKINY